MIRLDLDEATGISTTSTFLKKPAFSAASLGFLDLTAAHSNDGT